jgi:hypothetical protein
MQISENEQVFAQDIRRRKSGRKKEISCELGPHMGGTEEVILCVERHFGGYQCSIQDSSVFHHCGRGQDVP